MKVLRIPMFLLALLVASPSFAAQFSAIVSVAPLKYFAEKIGGDRVAVSVMVAPGANPATYEPKPRQMAALAQAKLYVAIGVPFEKAWLPRMRDAGPDMRVVNGAEGLDLMMMKEHHHGEEEGVHEEHDEHGGIPDPHVWTSPRESKKLAANILKAFEQADPEGSEVFRKNCDKLIAEIDGVDAKLKSLLSNRKGTMFLVYHPSWGYFARDYGLEQVPVELEGKEPGPRDLAGVIKMARKKGIQVVFAQPQFSQKSAQVIATAINGRVIQADPLAENWPTNLLQVGREMRNALR